MPPSSTTASLFTTHLSLDTHGAGMLTARSFRSITVTTHRVRELNWHWAPSTARTRYNAVLFPADGLSSAVSVQAAGATAPIGVFLPSMVSYHLPWEPAAEILAVWVPELLLQEFTEKESLNVTLLDSTPLTVGFRVFAHAISRHADEGSSISKYAIERLLAEMTFGALLEQHSVETAQRPSSLVERARSLMLVRREDPEFTMTQLAAELHISPRQLQRAFAERESTPGEMLRRMRVELAESMLRNPLYAGLTVDEVARYCGFTSALKLRRALRTEGAPSPTELRKLAEISAQS